MCDESGELFIKPCVQAEVDFYAAAQSSHPEFYALMPCQYGTLKLGPATDVPLPDAVKEEIAAVVASQTGGPEAQNATARALNVNSKKIDTELAIALENSSHGFTNPNILDAKLGSRLWADDAAQAKKDRFDKITAVTTHRNLGFRIAGMRVFRGSEDMSKLDEDGYKIYDKDYGRLKVNDENVLHAFRKFVFNKSASIDETLGKEICAAFVKDLEKVEEVMNAHESRMYSASVLFVFEGNGAILRTALSQDNVAENTLAHKVEVERELTNKRIDSGIALEESEYSEDEDPNAGYDDSGSLDEDAELSSVPRAYSLKLIDFAHAQWTPGQGPDENSLKGVTSLRKIFAHLAKNGKNTRRDASYLDAV